MGGMSEHSQPSTVTYRLAERDELGSIADLAAASFADYPFFTFVFRDAFSDESDYLKFIRSLLLMYFRAIARRNDCLVGVLDGSIVSVALMQNPTNKRPGLLNYIVSGGWRIPWRVGLKRVLDFRRISDDTDRDCFTRYPQAWYVELLAVQSNHRGQRLGSRMIQDCMIPYVRRKGGNAITLITNTEPNRRFYTSNGFTEFLSQPVERNGITVGNWSYYMDLDD